MVNNVFSLFSRIEYGKYYFNFFISGISEINFMLVKIILRIRIFLSVVVIYKF